MFLDKKKRKARKFKTVFALPKLEKKDGSLPHKGFLFLLLLFVSLFTLLTVTFVETLPLLQLGGLVLMVFTVNIIYSLYLLSSHRQLVENRPAIFRYCLILITPLLLARIGLYFDWPIEAFAGYFIVPIGFFAIVFSLGYSLSLGMVNSLWIAFCIGLMTNSNTILSPALLFPLVAGGFAAVYIFDRIQTPVGLRRLGIVIGLAQAFSYYGVTFMTHPYLLEASVQYQTQHLMYIPLYWFLNGLLTGWILSESLPFIEKMFNIVTDIRLHKLAEQNHPLLKKLNLVAPGTYHHSIMVGTLSEAATEAIGGNALLSRVGAYFHDIGKMLKPDYYIENLSPHQKNKHEGLSPAMSTLIIIAHPRDGAEMAREYGLPQRIIDFQLEHHGTTLVKYFYQKAMKLAEESGEEVNESSFRYPGPKPQSKETAIISLADPVEAASRTLVDPTPASIQRLVDSLVEDRIQDGQLDECEITLEEISIIKKTFVRILLSIFHGRISYDREKKEEEEPEGEKKESGLEKSVSAKAASRS